MTYTEPQMRRPFSPHSLLMPVALRAFLLFAVSSQSYEEKHDAAYPRTLASYSKILKLGMKRKDVEDYLRSKGIAFQRMCCVEEKTTLADLVKIGKERHPWCCSNHNVYVAFEFASTEPSAPRSPRDG
jgi:Iap family predicted aminopeptidase